MKSDRKDGDRGFIEGSVKTYRAAIRMMDQSWSSVTGHELDVGGRPPREAFVEALRQFESRLRELSPEQKGQLERDLQKRTSLEPDVQDLIQDGRGAGDLDKLISRDMDRVPPRMCLDIMRDVALEIADENQVQERPLRDYFREVVKRLSLKMGWEPPLRVGENRHFFRLWQYFCEFSESTWDWNEEEYAARAMNVRGPVPEFPSDLEGLRLRVAPFFR